MATSRKPAGSEAVEIKRIRRILGDPSRTEIST
jgi:hypothetical protein